MKATFLNSEKPLLTAMVICTTADACIEKIKASEAAGADAFGIQLERLEKQYRTEEHLRAIFAACGDKPIYITSYRYGENEDLTEEQRVDLLLLALDCGATLCDVMGDLYCKSEKEITYDEAAVEKQKALIAEIHRRGGEVLMSCHTGAKLTAEETLEIAKAQQERGADVCKIVNVTENIEEMPECFRTIQLLKSSLQSKFLYLVNGPCAVMIRQTGPNLGVCTYLCVQNHGQFDNQSQPVLGNMKAVRDHMKF